MDFLDGSAGKESTCSAGDARDLGSIPRLGRSSGRVHGYPLQYSCLENPMFWGVTVHGATKNRTQLKLLSSSSSSRPCAVSRTLFLMTQLCNGYDFPYLQTAESLRKIKSPAPWLSASKDEI